MASKKEITSTKKALAAAKKILGQQVTTQDIKRLQDERIDFDRALHEAVSKAAKAAFGIQDHGVSQEEELKVMEEVLAESDKLLQHFKN